MSTWWLTGCVILMAAVAQYAQGRLISGAARDHQSQPLIYPPSVVEHMTFGYNESMADALWLRAIQDFDFCGQELEGARATYGEGDVPRCRQGWSYLMLDAATTLAPRFLTIYRSGAIFLSIVVDDIEGASRLFDKGLKVYPDNWVLLYRAAYHKMADENNIEEAAELFARAGANGAPDWVYLLAARLHSDVGRVEIGMATLKDYMGDTPFESWPPAVQERWYDLEQRRGEL